MKEVRLFGVELIRIFIVFLFLQVEKVVCWVIGGFGFLIVILVLLMIRCVVGNFEQKFLGVKKLIKFLLG